MVDEESDVSGRDVTVADDEVKNLVIDCDPGADDLIALLYTAYLVATGRVRLLGIGSVFGNVGALPGADNALRVLTMCGLDEVSVAIGADRALTGAREHLGEFVHGHDGLGGYAGALPARKPVVETAAEQIVRMARSRPGEVSLLALGPLTNVALALALEPRLPDLLAEVVWMGGRVAVPGNLTAFADANTYHDPEAAHRVLTAGLPLTVVPMDVTRHAWVGEDWLGRLARQGGEIGRFAHDALGHYVSLYTDLEGPARGERGCVLHDPMALVLMMDPELGDYLHAPITVELHGTRTRGMTLVDQRGYATPADPAPPHPSVRIAMSVEHPTIMTRVLDGVTSLGTAATR